MPGPTTERRPELANGTVEHCPPEPTWRGRSGSLELEARSTKSPPDEALGHSSFSKYLGSTPKGKTPRFPPFLSGSILRIGSTFRANRPRGAGASWLRARVPAVVFGRLDKHIHAVLDPVTDRSGEVYEIVGTATDMTEQIRAETELRRSEAYLAEAQRISHTGCWARNPISGALFCVTGGVAHLRPRSGKDEAVI